MPTKVDVDRLVMYNRSMDNGTITIIVGTRWVCRRRTKWYLSDNESSAKKFLSVREAHLASDAIALAAGTPEKHYLLFGDLYSGNIVPHEPGKCFAVDASIDLSQDDF